MSTRALITVENDYGHIFKFSFAYGHPEEILPSALNNICMHINMSHNSLWDDSPENIGYTVMANLAVYAKAYGLDHSGTLLAIFPYIPDNDVPSTEYPTWRDRIYDCKYHISPNGIKFRWNFPDGKWQSIDQLFYYQELYH